MAKRSNIFFRIYQPLTTHRLVYMQFEFSLQKQGINTPQII